MSRVRILNLPNDCTEDQLRQHIVRTAPRDAPLLEITDVQFIRRPANAKDREHHKKQQKQKQMGRSGAAPKLVLRMVFVGFRTSAAGHFVAEYFNNSFFQSARLRVELAKGLNDVGVTINQQRKQQAAEQRAARREEKAQKATDTTARKRSRDTADSGRDDGDHEGNGDAAAAASTTAAPDGLARRQREFVDQRSKATEGPTWASEVLIAPATDSEASAHASSSPSTVAAAAGGASSAVSKNRKHDDTEGLLEEATVKKRRHDTPSATAAATSTAKQRSISNASGDTREEGPSDGDEEEEDEAEMERRALERQQALGAVDDMDFLAALSGGGGSGGGAGGSQRREGERATADASAVETSDYDDDDEKAEEEAEEEEHKAESDTLAEGHASPSTAAAVSANAKEKKGDDKAEAEAQSAEAQADIARLSHRIRLGNIPYIATEEHIKQFAASLVGPVDAVHIPLTKDTRQNKGAAFVRFVSAEDAVRALQLCRGAILMGRLLRVSAAEEDPHSRRVLEREAAIASSTAAAAAGAGGGGAHTDSLPGSSQFKKQHEAQRRLEGVAAGANGSGGGGGHVTWNSMYMNSHAAVETVAQRLGVRSEDVVGVQAKGAAVRAAIAEAYLTSEVQQVLSDEGIAFDLLEGATQNFLKARSNTTILVKNLQLKDGNDAAALTKLFVRFGVLETSAFPSAGTFALFRFSHPQDARIAFTRLSYKLFNTSPLFLEWAPVGALTEEGDSAAAAAAAADLGLSASGDETATGASGGVSAATATVFTLFITNVPFQTTEDELHAFLLDACPRLARSPDTLIKRLVLQQEQGRAFLTVADESTLTYCVAKINGRTLAGRALACVVSKQTTQMQQHKLARAAEVEGDGPYAGATAPTAAMGHGLASKHTTSTPGRGHDNGDDDDEDDPSKTAVIARRRNDGAGVSAASSKVPAGCDPLKIIVKNLPFEATEKDVRELFAAFSEIRTVRLPRKSHTFSSHRENNHRGFAFVEFLSEAEAARALETLKATHLYGRHLVLQYAKLDG